MTSNFSEPIKPATTRTTAAGMMVTGGSQVWRVLVTLISAAVLGRLLSPSDFGLMATVGPILAFVTMLQSLGFNQAIIQREEITKTQIDALFWVALGLSLVLTVALVLAAPAFARFFNEPRLAAIVAATGSLVLLAALTSQPSALLSRRLDFGTLARIDMIAVTVGALVSFGVAYVTRSYWALFIAQLVTAIIIAAQLWRASRWMPGRPVFDRQVREMAGFGAGLSTFNILNFLSRNAASLLIAKYNGVTPLGFYDRAYKLMLFPLTQATYPLGRVMTPVLSRLQSDPAAYQRSYWNAVTTLLLVVQPGVLAAVFFADDVIGLLLGPGWSEAAPIFVWLGVAGLHQVYTATTGWLLVSQGRGRDSAIIGAYGASTTVASYVAGLSWGPLGVAIAYAASDYIVRLPFIWWMVGRRGPIDTPAIVKAFAPHALGLGVGAALLAGLRAGPDLPAVLTLGLAMLLAYGAAIGVLWLVPAKREMVRKMAKTAAAAAAGLRARLRGSRACA